MTRSLLPISCALLFSLPLLAGSACAEPAHDEPPRATFQVEAVREVANDWATARMTVQAEGKRAAEVAARVNAEMEAAMETVKGASGIEVRSGGYSTNPVYDDGRVVSWRASQTLLLESGDTDALSRLIGTLQSKSVLLSGIEFGVRRETRREVEDTLIREALTRFRARAALVAEGLGAARWSVADVSVGAASSAPPPVFRRERAMTMSSAPAPSFAAGTSEIRVTASGTVRLD
ncbi:MAG: SIMPL domain-containing protein [Myxococcota bacterium]